MADPISPNMSLRRFNCIFVGAGLFCHTFGFAAYFWITYTLEITNAPNFVIRIGLWQLCLRQEPFKSWTCGGLNNDAIGGESLLAELGTVAFSSQKCTDSSQNFIIIFFFFATKVT